MTKYKRSDSRGSVLIATVITVLVLCLLIGGIARWAISQESKAIEEDLLSVNQYWACVATWERFKGMARADKEAQTNDTTYIMWSGSDFSGLVDTIDFEHSVGNALVEFKIGTGVKEDNNAVDTLSLEVGSDETGGTVTIYPDINLPTAEGQAVFGDYENRWINLMSGSYQKLQIDYSIEYCDDQSSPPCDSADGYSSDANDYIYDLVITSWRYGT